MLQTVDVAPRSLNDYHDIIGAEAVEELRALAAPLRGARVLQINATPYGGGVSELLRSLVPLQRNLGLVADWKIIAGDESFFDATKRLHNGLQGARGPLSPLDRERYLAANRANARQLEEEYDVIIVHDPASIGRDIVFFVMKSSDGVVRAAFDACDVCYRERKGYRQSGDVMICNNCRRSFPSVDINVLQGGCNPAPIVRHVDGGRIVLRAADLDLGAAYF